MIETVSPSTAWPDSSRLRDRLRDAGIGLIECDPAGAVHAMPVGGEDWLGALLGRSPMVRRALAELADRWERDELDPCAAFPGLWLVPMPVNERRRRLGYEVAAIVTEPLLDAEHLLAMCQSAEQDYTLACRLLANLPPASDRDVRRLSRLVRSVFDDDRRSRADAHAVEDIGKQLGETYEEISLLYTIIQSMTMSQRPARFVQTACEELLATLPYRWIGAQFRRETSLLKGMEGRFLMAGSCDAPIKDLRRCAESLVEATELDRPKVIEPMANASDADLARLGRTILVHPVNRDKQVIGVLIAGDKQGPDGAASSVDMKLLGATATHMSIFLENLSLYEDLNSMFLGTLEALTASIDAKDRYTSGHSMRVAQLTQQLAVAAGMDEETAGRMRIAGLVHDVGKIGVPESVLTKPGKLSDEEFAWIRRHPEIGHRILKDIPQLSDILPGVLYHHERWDGHGYPAGIAGEEIPHIARMIALADSFDAMSSTRTYRGALSREKVMQEIEDQTGRQFDPELAPLFLTLDFSTFDELVLAHKASDNSIAPELGDAA